MKKKTKTRQRRCFVVFGPESSGTRLTTQFLMNCGCFGGSGHRQELDNPDWWIYVTEKPNIIVWRRSFPHGGMWPDPAIMLRRLTDHGYLPHFVYVFRSKTPTVASQVKVGHVRDQAEGSFKLLQAMAQMSAYALSFNIPWSMVTYEGLVHQPALRKSLAKELGLKFKDMEFRDENKKHL